MTLTREKSAQIYQDLCEVIPGGVNSPVRSFHGLGCPPLVAEGGKGDMLLDADGNFYIDYCCSWGALILGHCHAAVVQAVSEQLHKGSSFGITTALEERLARTLTTLIPSLDKVRFVSSGTEATMSALRLARGFTGRSHIVKFDGNYHGHTDCLLVQAGSGAFHVNTQASSSGVPESLIACTHSLPFNDCKAVSHFLRTQPDIAAVIVEPIAGNMGVVPPTAAFLQMLREETQKIGALLIFDEVITGFRVGLQGAQGLYGIQPDLSCFGKIIGAGLPVAAFGGKAHIMDHLAPLGKVYQAGTLSGNPLAMCAGLAVLTEISQPNFYNQLQAKTDRLLLPIQDYLAKRSLPVCVQRVGSMFTLFFGVKEVKDRCDLEGLSLPLFKEFFTTLLEKGIYIPPSAYESWFISCAHTEKNLDYTAEVILDFLKKL